ncbi:MAG: hypothetical protein ABIQ36_12445 [Rhodanobacter sp.]
MKQKILRGAIHYISAKSERLRPERGREYFTFTDQADGGWCMCIARSKQSRV